MTATSSTVAVMTDRSGSRIDHLDIAVPDIGSAMTGYGWPDRKPYSWLVDQGTVGTNMHLAFTVDSPADVRTFHAAALAAGATERDAPAVRDEYHADYYGGFVEDPHGINLEAVCHHPEPAG